MELQGPLHISQEVWEEEQLDGEPSFGRLADDDRPGAFVRGGAGSTEDGLDPSMRVLKVGGGVAVPWTEDLPVRPFLLLLRSQARWRIQADA